MKSIFNFLIAFLLFSNLCISQEVFYREKQSGVSLGIGFSDGKNSTGTSYNVSFVFNGTILLNGQFGTATYSDDNIITTEAEILGVGFGILSNKGKLPFASQMTLNYSSAKYKNISLSAEIFSIGYSIYRNLNPKKPINIVPQLFITYNIVSASNEYYLNSVSFTDNEISYGFIINLGYITHKLISPIVGLAIFKTESTSRIAFNVAVAFSNFRKEK